MEQGTIGDLTLFNAELGGSFLAARQWAGRLGARSLTLSYRDENIGDCGIRYSLFVIFSIMEIRSQIKVTDFLAALP